MDNPGNTIGVQARDLMRVLQAISRGMQLPLGSEALRDRLVAAGLARLDGEQRLALTPAGVARCQALQRRVESDAAALQFRERRAETAEGRDAFAALVVEMTQSEEQLLHCLLTVDRDGRLDGACAELQPLLIEAGLVAESDGALVLTEAGILRCQSLQHQKASDHEAGLGRAHPRGNDAPSS